MLAVIFCISALTVPAYATDSEPDLSLPAKSVSRSGDDGPMLVDGLVNIGDTKTYEMEIDHALFPEAMLYAFTQGLPGNVNIMVYDENEKLVSGMYLRGYIDVNSLATFSSPKNRCSIKSDEAIVKQYKVVVTAETNNVTYAMSVGTKDELAENFGGVANVTSVPKNIPSNAVSGFKIASFRSYLDLLDGEGDWYHYVADGYTYITARASKTENLAFTVYDPETTEVVYSTRSTDKGIDVRSTNPYIYEAYVQKGLNLEAGKDYFIKFYSTSALPVNPTDPYYYIHMGLPCLTSQEIRYNAPKSFYVPANRIITFNIEVPKGTFLPSARACKLADVVFSANSSMDNTYVESCKIVTPNGITVTPTNGRFSKFEEPSSLDYLENKDHVPLEGTWKVTIRTSKSLYFNFRLSGYCDIIQGNSGNETEG